MRRGASRPTLALMLEGAAGAAPSNTGASAGRDVKSQNLPCDYAVRPRGDARGSHFHPSLALRDYRYA